MTAFKDLGLSPEIQQALDELGYVEPTPIQEQAIPELLAGHDVIGQAQTGTGKTAAFGLPLLQYLDPDDEEVQAIVLTPTRELCIQVTQALRAYAEHLDVEVVAVFGGAPIRSQQSQLRSGAHVVVATVGRMMDLMGAPLAGPHRGPLRRPRRGRRDARPRLHRGRREDPPDVPERAPDGALLGDDAAADPAARRGLHVRPDDDQDHAEEADRRRDRSRPTSRSRPKTRRRNWSRC